MMDQDSKRGLPKILAIDDEKDILTMLQEHFSLRGFEVWTAPNAREGIEICKWLEPDIILLDLKMPGMDGDKAFPYLKRLSPKAKIYIISGYPNEIAREKAGGLGADAYLEKPVSILALESLIRDSHG